MIKYTTLEKLKEYIPNTGLTDEQLQAAIDRGTSMLDVEFGDNLGVQTVTRRIDGYDKPRIVLENVPTVITSIEYLVGKTWNTATVDYIDGCIVNTEEVLPKGYNNVKVVYTKGYEEVPEDLETFFLSYMANVITLSKGDGGSLSGEVVSKKANGLAITLKSPSEIVTQVIDSTFASTFEAIKSKYKNFIVLMCN